MNDEQILSELRARYKRLRLEIEKVKIAIRVFESNKILDLPEEQEEQINSMIPSKFDARLPYRSKILYVLKHADEPLFVREIWGAIDSLEPELIKNRKTFMSAISQNLSKLTGEGIIESKWLNGKKKYVLNI